MLPIAAGALPPELPEELRDQLLVRLGRTPGLGLLDLEQIEWGWGTLTRRSAERRVELPRGGFELRQGSVDESIGASIFSFSGNLFSRRDVEPFLRALRRWSPGRAILILVDHPLSRELEPLAAELKIDLVHTWGRSYSPWPRDPMSLLGSSQLGSVLTLRPNRQATRAFDSEMALELLQELPSELDEKLGGLRWGDAGIPFHNGNIVNTNSANWISLHTLEPRALELLGLDRVPVERFSERRTVEAYVGAVGSAARELEQLFGARTEFVHSLPDATLPAEKLFAEMRRLGGGAGFDLDSIFTTLPRADAPEAAHLVGSPSLGAQLIGAASNTELERFRSTYGIAVSGSELAERLTGAQSSPRAIALGEFLDGIASHLGAGVYRVPLLLVPTTLLENAADYPDPDFLIGWNNIVLQIGDGSNRAEGFASGLESGDRAAEVLFAELGYELALLPPLAESVRRNGGYRCASNHIRGLD